MQPIIDLERAAALHWRGTTEERLGEWLLRAAEGFTGRANSALPLGDPGMPVGEAVDAVTDWYRSRGLPPMIVVPLPIANGYSTASEGNSTAPEIDPPLHEFDAYLSERRWVTRSGPAFVMVADLPLNSPLDGLPEGTRYRVDRQPDDAWLSVYHYRGQDRQPPVIRQVLASAPDQAFASIRDENAVLAIARVSTAGGWAGLTAVEVRQDHRRRGLGTAITSSACRFAEAVGLSKVFLQVETGNAAALALYERCGFRYSHRYHYRVAPAEP
jgi:ribosomal protein S18 acetylase RimI-like enzyme